MQWLVREKGNDDQRRYVVVEGSTGRRQTPQLQLLSGPSRTGGIFVQLRISPRAQEWQCWLSERLDKISGIESLHPNVVTLILCM